MCSELRLLATARMESESMHRSEPGAVARVAAPPPPPDISAILSPPQPRPAQSKPNIITHGMLLLSLFLFIGLNFEDQC